MLGTKSLIGTVSVSKYWFVIQRVDERAMWWERYSAPNFGEDVPCREVYEANKLVDPWFPDDSYQPHSTAVKLAKRTCTSCPMQAACMDYAMETGVPDGIWGGSTPHERRMIKWKPRMKNAKVG